MFSPSLPPYIVTSTSRRVGRQRVGPAAGGRARASPTGRRRRHAVAPVTPDAPGTSAGERVHRPPRVERRRLATAHQVSGRPAPSRPAAGVGGSVFSCGERRGPSRPTPSRCAAAPGRSAACRTRLRSPARRGRGERQPSFVADAVDSQATRRASPRRSAGRTAPARAPPRRQQRPAGAGPAVREAEAMAPRRTRPGRRPGTTGRRGYAGSRSIAWNSAVTSRPEPYAATRRSSVSAGSVSDPCRAHSRLATNAAVFGRPSSRSTNPRRRGRR